MLNLYRKYIKKKWYLVGHINEDVVMYVYCRRSRQARFVFCDKYHWADGFYMWTKEFETKEDALIYKLSNQ